MSFAIIGTGDELESKVWPLSLQLSLIESLSCGKCKMIKCGGQRDGEERNSCCSWRGQEFDSQHPRAAHNKL